MYTETNSADDTKGRLLYIDMEHFLWVLVAFGFGLTIMFMCYVRGGMDAIPAVLLGGFPLVATIAYLVIFRIGKPPHYQGDLARKWAGNTEIWRIGKKRNPYSEG